MPTITKRLDRLAAAIQPEDKIIVRVCWCGGEPDKHDPGCPCYGAPPADIVIGWPDDDDPED